MSAQNKRHPVVTASDIGKAEYCPYSLWLAKQRAPVSKTAKQRMKTGTVAHRKWDKAKDREGQKPLPAYVKLLLVAIVALVIYLVAN